MDSTVIVAGLGAVGLVASTWIGTRKTERAIREVQQNVSNVQVSVGTPNGKGDITAMLERLIEWRGEHMRDHQHLDELFGPAK